MKARLMPEIPDLEIESEGFGVWEIENYRTLAKREHGPVFHSGNYPWCEDDGKALQEILAKINQANPSFPVWKQCRTCFVLLGTRV